MQVDFLFWRIPDIPVLWVSALFFYVLVLVLLVSASARSWLLPRLDMSGVQKGGFHFGSLDVYRGLAALWIAAGHTFNRTYPLLAEWTGDIVSGSIAGRGTKAVMVFCVLSGFLIYRSVQRIDSRAAMQSYVRNRVLRIYPLYFTAITAAFILGFIPLELPKIVAELFMLKSFSDMAQLAMPNAWSLYAEILFYATIPVIAALISGRPLFWAIVLTAVLFAFTPIGLRLALVFPFFFIGIAASEILDRYGKHMNEAVAIAIFLIGCTLFAVDVAWKPGYAPILGFEAGAGNSPGIGIAFALIMLGSIGSRWLSAALTIRPLMILGTVSYSLFIIHPFLLYAAFPPVGLGADMAGRALLAKTMPVATWWYLPLVILPGMIFWSIVSFLAIERPFLMMRKRGKSQNPVGSLGTAPGEAGTTKGPHDRSEHSTVAVI